MNLSYILVSVLMGWLTAYLAEQRGRKWLTWFVVGFLLGVFGPILVYVFPALKQTSSMRKPASYSQDRNTIEVEAIIVPRSSGWFYLDKNHTQHGPHSLREVRNMWDESILQGSSFVWNETMEDWKQIVQVEDLIKYLKS